MKVKTFFTLMAFLITPLSFAKPLVTSKENLHFFFNKLQQSARTKDLISALSFQELLQKAVNSRGICFPTGSEDIEISDKYSFTETNVELVSIEPPRLVNYNVNKEGLNVVFNVTIDILKGSETARFRVPLVSYDSFDEVLVQSSTEGEENNFQNSVLITRDSLIGERLMIGQLQDWTGPLFDEFEFDVNQAYCL